MTKLLIRLFVKNSEDVLNPAVRRSYGSLSGGVGIFCNLFLCIIKIAVGFLTASISITADGLNNLSDMGSSVITLIGFKMAGKPADKDHPFGHGRMEYMSAFIVAVLILLVGAELLKSSVGALIAGDKFPDYSAAAIVVLAVSMLIKFWMYIFNRKLFKKVESGVFKATALDSFNDIMSTGAILLSVAVSLCFKLSFNLDAVMGLLVSLFILYSGFSTGRDTLNLILGNPPDKETVEEIKNTVLSFEGFIGIHDLMVHNYGPGRQFATVHVEVPQDSDFVKCHEQVDLCEKLINEKYNIQLVIHMDPIDTNSPAVKAARKALTAELKKIDERMSLHDFRMTPLSESRTNLIFDVVIPPEFNNKKEELRQEISAAAKKTDSTYCCVITFDNDFTGN
mgnify:FL=1